MEFRVGELLASPEKLARMRERARALAHPHAAREVLRVVLAHAPAT
jgi:UDP-N-acetylglucosamine:LPS N-acetylglucosamine transferase